MKNKPLILIIIAIITVAAVAGTLLYKPPAVKAKIGYMPAASYGLLWVAYEKGYFKDEGLDITLKEYPSLGQLVTALASGEIDGAPITSVAIAAFIKNIDAKIVAGNSLDGTALVVNSSFGLEDLTGLRGMILGTVQYVPGDFIFKRVISEAGINLTIKEYFTPSDTLTALESNKVDAALLWEPYASLAEYRDLRIAVWDEAIYPKDYPCCLQVFSNSFISSNPDAIVKFIKALVKAEAFTYAHSDEALPMVKKYLPSVPIEIVYKSIFFTDPSLNRARNPLSAYINLTELQQFYRLLVPNLLTENDYSVLVSKIDPSYYQTAISELKREGFNLPSRYAG